MHFVKLMINFMLMLFLISCGFKNKLSFEDSSNKIVNVERIVKLPDSLGGGSFYGTAIIEGKINAKTRNIVDFKVMKLLLKSKKTNREHLEYYYGIDTIKFKNEFEVMKRFKPFLEEYYKSLADFKNNQGIESDIYIYGMQVNF